LFASPVRAGVRHLPVAVCLLSATIIARLPAYARFFLIAFGDAWELWYAEKEAPVKNADKA
jgi:hypothetical protein